MAEDPQCSKCCPVEPPAVSAPWVPEWSVYLWLAAGAVGVVGGWLVILWAIIHL
jgi:hypothetical protein